MPIEMKTKVLYLCLLVILCGGSYFISSYLHPTTQKCPDDYSNDDAGSAEYLAAMDKWTNDFYDAHPGATLSDWAEARHQFYISNHCAAALERYEQAKAGKADPEIMKRVDNVIRDAVNNPTP